MSAPIFKVGYTSWDPALRASQIIESTGRSDLTLIVHHEVACADCKAVEYQAHKRLKRYRLSGAALLEILGPEVMPFSGHTEFFNCAGQSAGQKFYLPVCAVNEAIENINKSKKPDNDQYGVYNGSVWIKNF